MNVQITHLKKKRKDNTLVLFKIHGKSLMLYGKIDFLFNFD